MRTFHKRTLIILGLFIAILLTGAPAQAIPVEVVNDSSWTSIKGLIESSKQTIEQTKITMSSEMSRLEQIAEHAKTAKRWADEVAQYTRVISEDIRRFTSLKGILEVAEERLGLDEDTLKALSDIGETIRACYALKEQFESLVYTRLKMIENLYKRAKLGIFNPAQDLQDLDDYLRSGIGRSAARVVASRERLAQLDSELETWIYEWNQARKELAYKQSELNNIVKKLKEEGALSSDIRERTVSDKGERDKRDRWSGKRRENQSADAIATALVNKNLVEGQIGALNTRIADLIEKINQRYQRYHMTFDERKAKVNDIREAVRGWEAMIESKKQAIQEMVNPHRAP
jgi:DNA repair exonuclease SbcCD ATPase subunit